MSIAKIIRRDLDDVDSCANGAFIPKCDPARVRRVMQKGDGVNTYVAVVFLCDAEMRAVSAASEARDVNTACPIIHLHGNG